MEMWSEIQELFAHAILFPLVLVIRFVLVTVCLLGREIAFAIKFLALDIVQIAKEVLIIEAALIVVELIEHVRFEDVAAYRYIAIDKGDGGKSMKAWRFIWIAIFMLACSSNQKKEKISHRNKSTNQISYSSSSNITKLGKTGEEEYIPILKKIKNHRFYVKIALARLGDRKFQEMMLKENRFDILEEIGRPVVPLLLGELEENSKSNKTSIIRLLGKIKDRRATIVITKFLNSSDYKLRDAAIWALGELRDKRATAFLCRKQKANPLPIIVEALGKN